MQYQNELRKLKALVNKNVWEMFQKHNVIIAGGAITSTFCNREVNDIDVYFRNAKDYLKFVFDIFEGEHKFELIVNNITDRSVLLRDKYTNQDVQLIIYKFFENELAIFKDYDFTCNMGALSFGLEKRGRKGDAQFVLHPDFLKHNSQRYLSFNDGTAYPLISALRVSKYVEKGYSISKAQMLRVLMAVNAVSLNTWEEVKDHIGGMYGLNMADVFPVDEKFSLKKAMDCLDKLFSDGVKPNNKNLDLASLYAPVAKYFEDNVKQKEDCSGRFFKNVKKLPDGKLVSHYKNTFEYKVGETVNGGKEGIWVHSGSNVIGGTYYNHKDSVILELVGEQEEEHWDLRLKGDVFVKAVYTEEEFKDKFDCGGDIPQHVRDMLDLYESGEDDEEF